ncbi:MAG: hypothetical protein KBC96_13850 [Armatimonadetes bacterium]|nr:hypothetical protein [Armatimonadota bacterium]
MKLIIVLAAAFALAASARAATDRFVQDRFVISFWVDPPADQITNARYKEIADANFTVVHGAFGPQTEADVARQVELCKKYGLAVITKSHGIPIEKLPDDPVVWGYHLVDEPGAAGIPDVKAKVDAVRKLRPGKLAYFNLLPNYAALSWLGTKSYDEYIERFAKETGCDVLCMDYYPMMTPTADGREGYCDNLAVMRKWSVEMGIPHWNFFNTMPFGPHHDPTEAQLRWQIYTSLAYGSKGILYFCYWTPGKGAGGGGEFPKGGAIITAEGIRTRHYEQAKRINFALKNMGPTLMKLTSTDVIRIKPTDDPAAKLEGSPLKNISKGGDYLIGVFKHKYGRRAVLINNYDCNYTSWPTVEFAVPLESVREVDQSTGKQVPVRDDSPEMAGLQLSLDAGEGRLFLLR